MGTAETDTDNNPLLFFLQKMMSLGPIYKNTSKAQYVQDHEPVLGTQETYY